MLNKISIGLLLLCFSIIYSCNSHDSKREDNKPEVVADQPQIIPGTMLNHSSTESGSYTLYAPTSYSKEKKYPVLILLDPHGKGSFPIGKYKSLADKFGVFLMGSNDSKNGLPIEECVTIVQRLANESKQFPFGNGDISLCGFSGGAKIALVAGNQIPQFSSIIYCGAALPIQSIQLQTPLLGIAGKKDMNYTEVENFSKWAASQIKVNGIFEWNGKHEWPDSMTFQYAFYWQLLNGKNVDKELVDEYIMYSNDIIDHEKALLRKTELLSSMISVLEDKANVKKLKNDLRLILLSADYNKAKTAQQVEITREEETKKEFLNSFESQSLSWWSEKIKNLRVTNSESNQRLLGYISLASWSFSTKALEMSNLPFASKVLEIYRMADPENSEHEFLRASLQASINQPDSAIYYLREAVKLGLDDRSKIENDKYLASLRGRQDFNEVVAKMNGN